MPSCTEAVEILRAHAPELRARGVRRAAVFGSVARGEATATSDLDIMIELDKSVRMTMFDYVGLKRTIAALFPCTTDIAASPCGGSARISARSMP